MSRRWRWREWGMGAIWQGCLAVLHYSARNPSAPLEVIVWSRQLGGPTSTLDGDHPMSQFQTFGTTPPAKVVFTSSNGHMFVDYKNSEDLRRYLTPNG